MSRASSGSSRDGVKGSPVTLILRIHLHISRGGDYESGGHLNNPSKGMQDDKLLSDVPSYARHTVMCALLTMPTA